MKNVMIVLAICIFGLVMLARKIHSPCEQLLSISENPQILSMLFEKMTFYLSDPTRLAKYELISDHPLLVTRFSYDINHGLDIDWKALDIDPNHATFAYIGKSESKPLDYRNINAAEVSAIAIGIGARFRLLFEIKSNMSSKEYYSDASSIKYTVKVECHR